MAIDEDEAKKPVLQLTGDITIESLIYVLSEVASYCGDYSHITLADTPIALAVADNARDFEEQKEIVGHMLDTLANYPQIQAKVIE